MNRMIPLAHLPYFARALESQARRETGTRAKQIEVAKYEITLAPGCYSEAYAPRVGWVMTQQAADALASRLTHMPGGTSHHRLTWELWTAPRLTSVAA